ncbi:MAG: hypothetical protein OEW19_13275 [Acidobacteriota bacterium]|nr:hypothetical protein [Acidobacteriota bacterium]
MSAVFSKDGVRGLRISWVLLALALVTSAALAAGSYWFLQQEKRDAITLAKRLQQSKARNDAVKREIEDMRASSTVFQDLLDRGILQEGSRLDFIERLDQLKNSHGLINLEYEIDPQRVLTLADGRVFNALDVMGSRVKLRLKALHEGDALAFLEDLSTPKRGFNAMSRCHLQRIERASADVSSPRVEASCTMEWISLKDKVKANAS